MDEFMNTIMKLNTEGVGGFENFETQARKCNRWCKYFYNKHENLL